MKIGNTNVIIKSSEIAAKTARIKDAAAKLDSDIHQVAVSAAYHCQQHGNATPMADLLNAMGKASRKKAMVEWMQDHFPVTCAYDKKAKAYKVSPKKGRTTDQFKLEDAEALPFWDYTVEKNPAKRTPLTIIKTAATGMTKLAEAGDADAIQLAEALVKLQKLLESREAEAKGDNVVALPKAA